MEKRINFFSDIASKVFKKHISNRRYDKIFTYFRKLDRRAESILLFLKIQKHNIILIIINIAILFFLEFLFRKYFKFDIKELKENLNVLLTAASILIALTISFLISKYFAINQERRDIVNKYRNLQYEFQPYQRAFYDLKEHLYRRFKFNFQFGIPYRKVLHNLDWNDPNVHASGISFVRALSELSDDLFFFNDFDVDFRIIPKEQLLKYDCALGHLGGTLARSKRYEPLLEDFSLDKGKGLDNNIINSTTIFIERSASKIAKNDEMSYWKTLEFWQTKFAEAHRLVSIMLNYVDFIQNYDAKFIKKGVFILIISAIGGIFTPLILLFFDVPFFYILMKYGLILFILSFTSTLYYLAVEFSSKSMYNIN